MSGIIRNNQTKSSGVIKGLTGVPSIAGDKSPATVGDMWYNSSASTLRCYIPLAAWSSGGNLGTARKQFWGCGTQSAALVAGGATPAMNTTEEYDGSSWGAGGNTAGPASEAHMMAGTVPSALKAGGGWVLATSETYNGSTWSSGTAIPAPRFGPMGFGSSATDALVVGGYNPPSTHDDTYVWDGSSWSTEGLISSNRYYASACGTTSAGIFTGGSTGWPDHDASTETFNGSVWSDTGNDYPILMSKGSMAGSSSDCLTVAGDNRSASPTAETNIAYTYDGSSWSSSTVYPQIGQHLGGSNASTSTAAIAFMGGALGSPAALANNTYEWTDAVSNATITTS